MGDIWPLTFEDSSSNCRKAVRRALMTKWNVLVAIFGSMSGIILLSSFLDLLNTNLSIFDGEFWSENFFTLYLAIQIVVSLLVIRRLYLAFPLEDADFNYLGLDRASMELLRHVFDYIGIISILLAPALVAMSASDEWLLLPSVLVLVLMLWVYCDSVYRRKKFKSFKFIKAVFFPVTLIVLLDYSPTTVAIVKYLLYIIV